MSRCFYIFWSNGGLALLLGKVLMGHLCARILRTIHKGVSRVIKALDFDPACC